MAWTLVGNFNGGGLPSGGTLNQVPMKNSATDGDASWKTITASMISGLAAVATTRSYTDLIDTPTLGTAASKAVSDIVPTPSASGLVLTSTGSGAYGWVAGGAAPVSSVANRTGAIILTYADIAGLGTAAQQDVSAFATAAQGAKADTAVQPAGLSKLVAYAGTGTTPRYLGALSTIPSATAPDGSALLDGDFFDYVGS